MKKIIRQLNNQCGLVYVEASIIFPIMFFIIFFVIFIGNSYHEKAQMENLVNQAALKGAQAVVDPSYMKLNEFQKANSGNLPDVSSDTKIYSETYGNTQPYRYIFGASDVEAAVEKEVRDKVSKGGLNFFKIMSPQNVTVKAKFENYVLYSYFTVEANYKLKFPIRFIGDKNDTVMFMTAKATAPVNDTAEFIRNVDYAVDLVEDTTVGQKVADLFKKANELIQKFANK